MVTAEKTSKVLLCVCCIVCLIVYVVMLLDMLDRKKQSNIRHEERLKGYQTENEIYELVKQGIKSGELKVAVVTKEGLLFSKEVKKKTNKKSK